MQKKDRQGTITDEEEIELAGIDKLLAEAKDDKKYYRELIKLSMKDEPPESKSFSEADSEWIQAVTGVNTTYRKWTGYTIDVNIQPRPGFQTKFEEVARAFHQQNEAGRRIFNLYRNIFTKLAALDGLSLGRLCAINAFSEFLLINFSSFSKSKSFSATTLLIQAVSCSDICSKQCDITVVN